MDKYEDLAKAIEKMQNLVYSNRTSSDIHCMAVQGSMIDILAELRVAYKKLTGIDPWE